MKVLTVIARILLGLIFVFFGSNGLLHFLPMPPLPQGVIVNVWAFHLLMAPEGLPPAVVVTVLELFLVWSYRDRFAGILRP